MGLIGTLDNRHQTLALMPGQSSSTGAWSLDGGRIDGGAISTSGGAALTATYQGGVLDGVTLNGALDMSLGGTVTVVDGLTLNTDLYLGYLATLQFNDGSTVTAGPLVPGATIHLSGPYSQLYNATSDNAALNYPAQTVTVGRHVTISGENYTRIIGPIDNLGTIEQNTAGRLFVTELVNDGSVQATQGGIMSLEDDIPFFGIPGQAWSNNADGTITATGASQ